MARWVDGSMDGSIDRQEEGRRQHITDHNIAVSFLFV